MHSVTGRLRLPRYRADIDGLRAIAVCAVIGFHAFPSLVPGGFVGVDIFFVISGFLISTIIFSNLNCDNFRFLEFYRRRINRIFPALLLVLGVSFAFGEYALFIDEQALLGKHIAAGAGFVSNIALWTERGYFNQIAEVKPLLHLWSLGIEEQFYIIWPLLIWAGWKAQFNLVKLIVAIVVVSFAINIWTINVDIVTAFYWPQTRFWELLVGALLAWVALQESSAKLYAPFSRLFVTTIHGQARETVVGWIWNIQSWFGVSLIAISLSLITKESRFPGWYALMPTLGSMLIVAAGPRAWLNRVVLSNRLLVWLGLISYPLYLWHWPLLSFATIVESGQPAIKIRLAAIIIAFGFAWLTYIFVERPIRHGVQGNKKAWVLLLAMFALGLIGYESSKHKTLELQSANTRNMELLEQGFIDSCSLSLKEIVHCAEAKKTGKKVVLMIGDSHVRSAYEIIKGQMSQAGFNLIALSNGGCPFLVDVNTANVDDCALKNGKVLEYINANKSFIKAILLVGEYSTYARPGWLRKRNGNAIGFGESLMESLALIREFPTILFEQVPPVSFSPRKCLKRPFQISKRIIDCRSNYGDAMASLATSRSGIYRSIENFSNVTLFNMDGVFCADGKCDVMANGEVLYYNETHLNPLGVDYVRQRIKFDKVLFSAFTNSKP